MACQTRQSVFLEQTKLLIVTGCWDHGQVLQTGMNQVCASGVITDPTFGAFIMVTKMMFCGDDEMCVIMGRGLMTFVVICKQR